MKHIITVFFLLISITLSAQKMGIISEEIIQQKYSEIDSLAHAEYINKQVEINYFFTDAGGKILQEATHYHKIKIYDENGESYGNIEIPHYYGKEGIEKITKITGATYNYENGKVVKTKLNKKDIFREELSKNNRVVKFAMPNVKPGSIVEYRYSIRSPFIYSIPTWYFQNKIPTKLARYIINVPSYFNLTPISTGANLISVDKEVVPNSPHGVIKYSYTGFKIKPIKKDKYVLNINDYRSGVKYELYSIRMPNSALQNFSKDWNEIAKNLSESSYFGKQIKKKFSALDNIIDEAMEMDVSERVKFLYGYIRNNYTWNKRYGRGAYDGLAKVIKNKTGSAGELNLLLQNLLTKCEINSYPVVLKSRQNGLLNTKYPTLTELNYIIVYVKSEDGYTLLDASSRLTPFGELPLRAVNLSGVIIQSDEASIINFDNPNIYKVQTVSNYAIDVKNNKIEGTSQRKRSGYAATKYRIDLQNDDDDSQEENDEYFNTIDEQADEFESLDIENTYEVTKIENVDILEKPIKVEYNEKLVNCSKIIGEKIFINSTLDFGLTENDFDEPSRDYPIFYDTKVNITTISNLVIPNGYILESKPESINLTLPERKASFNYDIKSHGNKLIITYKFQINEALFLAEEYPNLKKLYDMIVELSQQKIVLSLNE